MTCHPLRTSLIALACLGALSASFAQNQPAAREPLPDSKIPVYDVVSIKPNKTGPGHTGIDVDDGNFKAENVSTKNMVLIAYGLKASQLVGLPSWANSARYDIQAKVLEPDRKIFAALTEDQGRKMLQPILTERFHLKFHRETKMLPVYELVLAKGGPKFKDSTIPDDRVTKGANGMGAGSISVHNTELSATAVALSSLTDVLSDQTNRVVVDKTGLTGKYDLELKWLPADAPAAPDSTLTTLFTALQEQLGLKLQPGKAEISTFVVDSMEAPSEN